MKAPVRVTIALDKDTVEMLKNLRKKLDQSQSEIIRNALKFYHSLQDYDLEKIKIYVEMLSEGEHVILDIDHWIAFLKFIESHPKKDDFWEFHRKVAKSHAEQFKDMSFEEILRRLEACNFFRLNKTSEKEYTLIFGNEETKFFVKTFLEEIFGEINVKVRIGEDLAKLRISIE
ncbi:CopG domain protein DNA-binding domain protein [Ferroglobus placidus DSM 10642]|uniref:CopG domain protein DNA-binding domain protein n=1 Tax=Ferroglobus placidus (strain DSM 10642 / AEDII12DO) TaxID=589924 RepID=D3S169_FERPA|nr:ribbon-helix-helix protein, CopG family [Ferroglobus placidus]ADC64305.1 CopG domain protein DNA-binding domain protein [Ferroglobus placidus DSM 10642]